MSVRHRQGGRESGVVVKRSSTVVTAFKNFRVYFNIDFNVGRGGMQGLGRSPEVASSHKPHGNYASCSFYFFFYCWVQLIASPLEGCVHSNPQEEC